MGIDFEQLFKYNRVMYRNDELIELVKKAIPAQQEKKTFVTVREVADLWGMSVGKTYNLLQIIVGRGMAEKSGSHYHLKDAQ